MVYILIFGTLVIFFVLFCFVLFFQLHRDRVKSAYQILSYYVNETGKTEVFIFSVIHNFLKRV